MLGEGIKGARNASGAEQAIPATPRPLLGGRLAGPGGLYNLGNGIGLIGGMALAVAAGAQSMDLTLGSGLAAIWQHFAGNLGAIAISAAMLMFFWSGEHYHQAWARGFPPLARRNLLGDLWSGYGALSLGLGLFLTGQPFLAATAGLMHAAGKFGSAFGWSRSFLLAGKQIDLFRLVVLASRLPAIALVLMEIAAATQPASLMSPVMLLVCYVIWCRADLLLFGAD